MGLLSQDIETMGDLFVHQLGDIHYAERRIVGALPEMIAKASSPRLRRAFELHLEQTRGHIHRVERAFEMIGKTPIR